MGCSLTLSTACAVLQGARTASELALQLRKLDGQIQWEALKRPVMDSDSPFASAEILSRRPQSTPGKGWEYLVQMVALVEASAGSGFGTFAANLRQPLQPLTAAPGQLAVSHHQQQQQQQLQQQLMSKQKPPQQLSMALAAPPQQQRPQEAEQRQHPSAQLPDQALSLLPNDVTVQQRQQAYGEEGDEQIAVEQAVSTLSDAELPSQLPKIAASVRRASESTLPDQAQPQDLVSRDKLAQHHVIEPHDGVSGVSAEAGQAKSSISPQAPSGHSTQANGNLVPQDMSVANRSAQLPVSQIIDGNAKLSQHEESKSKSDASGVSSQLPAAAMQSWPVASQSMPKQASSLSSLIPAQSQQQATPSQPLGLFGRGPGAGPSGTAPGLSRMGAPAQQGAAQFSPAPLSPATWVHESQLPLWLVKTFEEKRRRDIAMVAARAAQQAHRDANAASRSLNATQPWRTECKLPHCSLNSAAAEWYQTD